MTDADLVLTRPIANQKIMVKEKLHILLMCLILTAMSHASAASGDTIVFIPQWTAQAQFAGYYVAQAKGFYREAGVKVRIVHPSVAQPAMDRLMAGECQSTTLTLCQAMQIVDTQTPLVNILQTSMNNAMVIVSARQKNPLTQKGARVGLWSVDFGQLALCMNIRDRLGYRWVRFAQNTNLFLSGALDAMVTMSYNEYYQLVQAGFDISDKNTYRFCNHEYNVQEDGLYMLKSYYDTHREQAKRFALASRKGWQWAAEHPEEALDIVMQYVGKDHVATNRTMQRLMLNEILRLQVDKESGKREFRLRSDMVEKASRLMFENHLLSRQVRYDELVD